MPRSKAPSAAKVPAQDADPEVVTCAAPECSNTLAPKRSTARYCGTTCRQRAARARRAAKHAEEIDAAAETEPGEGGAEHGLVKATRLELEKADALNTVDGQIALQLARKLTDPDHVSPGLAKELRATLAAAKGAATPAAAEGGTDPEPEPEEDEVTRARRARAEAREAAGRS